MPEILDRVIVLNLFANTLIFYVAARLYLMPLLPRVRPQQILVPDPASAFNAAFGNHVSDARGNVPGIATRIRVSGRVRRFLDVVTMGPWASAGRDPD